MMKKWNNVRAMVMGLGLVGATTLLGACQSEMKGGLPDTAQMEDSYFYGHWKSSDGKKDLTVAPGGGKSFKLSVSDADGTRHYAGHLVRVDQQPFAELSMYQPTSSDGKKVPVYLYQHMKIEPTQFTVRPLKMSWMESAVKNLGGGARYVTAPGVKDQGGVVVKDGAAMQALLRKALNEPGSFEEGEVFKKVK